MSRQFLYRTRMHMKKANNIQQKNVMPIRFIQMLSTVHKNDLCRLGIKSCEIVKALRIEHAAPKRYSAANTENRLRIRTMQ